MRGRNLRKEGTLTQLDPVPHPSFPWLSQFPWHCTQCKRVTVLRSAANASPGTCPVCQKKVLPTSTTAGELWLLRTVLGVDVEGYPTRNGIEVDAGNAIVSALVGRGLLAKKGRLHVATRAGWASALRGNFGNTPKPKYGEFKK